MILITQSAAGLSIVIMEFVVLALILDDAADEVFYSLGLILFFLQLGLIIFSYIKYEYHFGFKVGSGDVSIDTIRGREQPMKPEEQSNQQDNNES